MISLEAYRESIKNGTTLPLFTVVDYRSVITDDYVSVDMLRTVERYENSSNYKPTCIERKIGILPEFQRLEVMTYLNESDQKCRVSIQESFVRPENYMAGLLPEQVIAVRKLLLNEASVPRLLDEAEMKEITEFTDLTGYHIWGSQMKKLLEKFGVTPMKTLNENKEHNKVKMLENEEIIDPEQFNPDANCGNGIYSTISSHFYNWLKYKNANMMYVADVVIFDDCQVAIESCYKFKMNRILLRNIRLIRDMPQWLDKDFVHRACKTHPTSISYVRDGSLEYKLQSLHGGTFMTNPSVDWNLEPYFLQVIAAQENSDIILKIRNPSLELQILAVMKCPSMVFTLKSENPMLYQLDYEYGDHDILPQIPSRFITEDMIRMHITNDNPNAITENVATAVLSMSPAFYESLFSTYTGFLFKAIQFADDLKTRLPQFVEEVASNPSLLKYMKDQPDWFQWAILRHAGAEYYMMRFLSNPTPEMLVFALDRFPTCLPDLPIELWTDDAMVRHLGADGEIEILFTEKYTPSHLLIERVFALKFPSELWESSSKKTRFYAQVNKNIDWNDNSTENVSFIEHLIEMRPEFYGSFIFPDRYKKYQSKAIAAAKQSGSVVELFSSFGYDWRFWEAESWRALLEVDFSKLPQLPRDNSCKFKSDYDALLLEFVQKDEKVFEEFHLSFRCELIEQCLEKNGSLIQHLDAPTGKQQRNAIEDDPDNIRYIEKPMDSVITLALSLEPAVFPLIQHFSNATLESRLKKTHGIKRGSSESVSSQSTEENKSPRIE